MRGERGEVLHGDNLDHLQQLAGVGGVRGEVALVYLDPPFGTGRDFGAYDDRLPGGRAQLVAAISARLRVLHTLLRDDGSILVHLDHRIAHLIAVQLDEIFGAGDREPAGATAAGFRNEIIWTYGLGGSSSRFYPRKHDTILWYSKGARWTFEAPRIPARSARMRGESKKQLDVFIGPPRVDDEPPIVLSDVWDVAAINNMAKERTGYPTQKPLALLEPLIAAHTAKNDLVLDPYCGSGTSLVAAVKLGRRALGIDLAEEAVTLARLRLQKITRG